MTLHERLKGPPIGVAAVGRIIHGEDGASRSRRSKIVRWFTRGLLVNGERMKLPGVKVGGQWYTSEAFLSAWIETTTAGAGGDVEPPRSPAERRRASERADAALTEAGW
ncbi:MAG: hypothetical protein U0804_16015 [Gemmataceae bacterium]